MKSEFYKTFIVFISFVTVTHLLISVNLLY